MKKSLISLLLSLAVAMPAMAQTSGPKFEEPPKVPDMVAEKAAPTETEEHGLGFWVETQVLKSGPTEAVVYFDKYLSESVGFYAQMVKDSSGYSSLYAGPKVKVAEGVEAGVGVGREVLSRGASSTTVRNIWMSVDSEKFSLYGTVENGSAGTWHKATAMYKLNDSTNVGLMNETSLGTGPRVEWSIGKFQVWGALLHTNGITTQMFAANISF